MDIDITGARILISKPEWGGFMLTETVVVTWIVMLVLVLACRFMTAHLEVHPTKKRQVIAEWIVTSIRDMVQTNMGEKYAQTWYVHSLARCLRCQPVAVCQALSARMPRQAISPPCWAGPCSSLH